MLKMAEFGHVQKVTKEVGGKVCTFRSLLEYRWAVWCQLRKEQGIILEWWFEDSECLLELETKYFKNKKLYLPDFTIAYRCKSCLGSGKKHCLLGVCIKTHARITCRPNGKDCKHYSPGKICPNCKGSGKRYELEETKGYFPPKDYTKLKLATEQYKNPITLIFASLNDHSKNSKIRAQYARAKKLEPFLKRIIYKADRDIFRPIKHLFEI